MRQHRYEVRVRVDEISTGHWLPGYEGPCARAHGHNWDFEVNIGADELADGMVVDFREVKAIIKELDHIMLNDHPGIVAGGRSPTCERVAEYLAEVIQTRLDQRANQPRLVAITVYETARNSVVYRPDANGAPQ